MRFICITFLLLAVHNGYAQYFPNWKEYRFVNEYNLALTAWKNEGVSTKTQVDNKGLPIKMTTTGSRVDTVYMSPINYTDPNQVWIVEYHSSICSNTGYFTIRAKVSGNYLTVLGYDESLKLDMSNLRLSGYRVALLKLQQKGEYDISDNQKWRFGNLDDLLTVNGNFRPIHTGAFWGRTKQVCLKNYVFENCSVSSFCFDLTYKHKAMNTGIQAQLMGNGLAYDNTRFQIVPNNPVTLITLKDINWAKCPKVLLRGNRDFSGRVEMNLRVDLELNAQRTAIMMKVYFKAEEPKGDNSATELHWSEKVYDAPVGLKIKSIVTNSSWSKAFGSNLNEQSFNFTPVEFLRYCEVVGDTMGDDISNDDNCDDDTWVGNFMFNKLAVIFE